MSDKFLRLPKVIERVGLQKTAIYAKIARGEFPEPIKLGQTVSVWLESEINDWIAERVAEYREVG